MPGEEKTPSIVLRNVPPKIYSLIVETKAEILKSNKGRGKVSNEEAIYKLIKRCG